MKLLFATLNFWLERSRGKNNDETDDKHNNTNTN